MSMTLLLQRRLPRAVAAVGAVILCASTAACSSSTPDVRVPTTSTSATPDAPVQVSSTPAAPDGPDVVQWGGQGHQLSVVVRNQADRTVRQARVLITALDRDGSLIAASSGDSRSTCCTVLGLPPGEDYGMFIDLPRPVEDVDSVLVRYIDAELAPTTKAAAYDVTSVELVRTADDTVVETEVTVDGDVGRYLVGQAFLVDPEDRLVGVISGRFYCFGKDDQRQIRMQLLHPTPPGTRVERVAYYPVPAGAPTGVGHTCE